MPTTKYIELIMSAQPKPGYTDVKQNDADGVQLVLSLKNSGGTAFIVPDGSIVMFNAVKSDRHSVVLSTTDANPKVSFSGNTVLVTLSAQTLAVAGIIVCEIIVSKDGATTSSQNFILSCAEDLNADDLTSSEEYQSLSKLLADLTARQAEFDNVDNKIASMSLGYGGTFATLTALQADATANTTDGKKKYYVITADAHYYSWNGAAWTDRGVFAAAVEGERANARIGHGVSGIQVSAWPEPTMAVNVDYGEVILPNGKHFTILSTDIDINTAHASYPRIDIIYISSNGIVSYLAGTAAASPSQPATPSGGELLADINVAAGATAITNANIVDKRTLLNDLTSTVKGKTFVNQSQRDNEIEANVLDLQNRLLLNAPNLITNGDFSNGSAGWVPVYASVNTNNNTAMLAGNSGGNTIALRQITGVNCVSGKKIYIKSKLMINKTDNITGLALRIDGTTAGSTSETLKTGIIANTWYDISAVQTIDGTLNGLIRPQCSAKSAVTIDNTYTLSIKEFIAIDLTELYGAGNEPTVQEFTALLSVAGISYFVTTNLINLPFILKMLSNCVHYKKGTFAARPTNGLLAPTLYMATDKAAGNADRITLSDDGGTTWLQQ